MKLKKLNDMKRIEVKIEITNIENWSVDWENKDDRVKELILLRWNLKAAISERCGILYDDISVELDLTDTCNSGIAALKSKDYGDDGVGLTSDEISSLI